MAVGCRWSCSYSRLKSLDQESIPLVTLIKSIAMGNFPKYRVAKVSEYLIITGVGTDNIKIVKKAWILPSQSCIIFDIHPVNCTFEVQAVSANKLPFLLPIVFTIGPQFSDEPSLYRCVKLINTNQKDLSHVQEIVKPVIERETRVMAASTTMEEIFRGTELIKKEVFDKVRLELKYFGLLIYNADVKQPVDVPGHNCCAYLGLKKLLPPLFKVIYEQTGLLPPDWICKNIES